MVFILPPLVGMIVQPLIGYYSDRTWTRFGRRMPYLLIAGPIGAIVLVLLPNAGSFNFGYASLMALSFGAVMTLLMDLTSNACMQPYKMIIGDMVNENKEIWHGLGNKFFKFRWYYCYGITIFINNVGNE